ncbi:MAG: flagellar biosynthesis anti-sigma factor FlgM [Lachnospiraceae bacterium]|jgi:negative regulator of flagellin synthesis FlgM|nr:flagellar biosynthesis anti-sigma factor FlgM [Lachnospiraceae bacterium]
MRIEAYNQITGIYKAASTTKVRESYGVGGRDEVQISRAGRDFQIAKQAVAKSADIREDKAAQLKAKIDAGEYQVSAGDFASKLMEKYNQYL